MVQNDFLKKKKIIFKSIIIVYGSEHRIIVITSRVGFELTVLIVIIKLCGTRPYRYQYA